MIKAISYWAFSGGGDGTKNIGEAMDEAKAAGYDGLELALGMKGEIHINSSEEDCKAVAKLARQKGIKLVSVATGLGWQFSLSASERSVRNRSIDVHARALLRCGWLGAKNLLIIPGHAVPLGEGEIIPYKTAYQQAVKGMKKLIPYAEKTKVNLCAEIVWNGMLYSPLEFARFLDDVGHRRACCYFDTGNVIKYGLAEQWIQLLGRKIKAVHFKDFDRSKAGLDGFCDLLKGDVNYPAVMAELRKISYKGPVTLETFDRTAKEIRTESKAMDKILKMG